MKTLWFVIATVAGSVLTRSWVATGRPEECRASLWEISCGCCQGQRQVAGRFRARQPSDSGRCWPSTLSRRRRDARGCWTTRPDCEQTSDNQWCVGCSGRRDKVPSSTLAQMADSSAHGASTGDGEEDLHLWTVGRWWSNRDQLLIRKMDAHWLDHGCDCKGPVGRRVWGRCPRAGGSELDPEVQRSKYPKI